MGDNSDLINLAQKLTSEGPHKTERSPRRIRALLNGKYIVDTIKAYYVWEHPYYPQYYIPLHSFTGNGNLERLSAVDGTNEAAHLARLTAGDKNTSRVLIFNTPKLPEQNLVRVEFSALDQWFEENVPIDVHPKDPYKRIDILSSSRQIKISLDDVTLAETSSPLILYETGLRPRYYIPPTHVQWENLSASGTETRCPYKGKANYYHVTVKGKVYRDLVWYYASATKESADVSGYLCFYNEKVDVWVDGVKEDR